jgi:DNA adenine methylase
MRYLGGKTRLVPFLLEVVRRVDRARYIEPFTGGGSVLAGLSPHFSTVEAGDAHPGLVALWNAVLGGWRPPEEITESEYADLRNSSEVTALQAYAGFACSFGGKWFGGFARKSDGTHDQSGSRASLLRKASVIRRHVNCLRLASFEEYSPDSDTLVYCDPPYVTSADYSTARWRPYDFWDSCREWVDRGAAGRVSEIQAPRDFIQISDTQRKF